MLHIYLSQSLNLKGRLQFVLPNRSCSDCFGQLSEIHILLELLTSSLGRKYSTRYQQCHLFSTQNETYFLPCTHDTFSHSPQRTDKHSISRTLKLCCTHQNSNFQLQLRRGILLYARVSQGRISIAVEITSSSINLAIVSKVSMCI
jgi:hypothetical protein